MLIQQPWTPRDDVLLHTCRIANMVITKGELATIPEVLAPFAPQVPGERLWSAGPFTLARWGLADVDDPEDQRPPGLVGWAVNEAVKTGLWYADGATHGLVGHIAQRRAWRKGQAAAIPQWVPFANGTLFISVYGFHLYTRQVYQWPWEGITGAQLSGPGVLDLTGNNGQQLVEWRLMSDWAELMFVTWALERHPKHPNIVTGWLPPGWIDHANAWGQAVPTPLTLSP